MTKQQIKSDGGATSYYDLPPSAKQLGDLIEYKNMNFNVGTIFKAAYRLGEKSGFDTAYDLRKILWSAQRELARLDAPAAKLQRTQEAVNAACEGVALGPLRVKRVCPHCDAQEGENHKDTCTYYVGVV